jgi:hypothetical protein
MYACIRGIGLRFFEGVHALNDHACISSDPPPSPLAIRVLLGRAPPCCQRRCELYAVGTHYQALLEGGVGGACLQRNHVPPPHLPHNP